MNELPMLLLGAAAGATITAILLLRARRPPKRPLVAATDLERIQARERDLSGREERVAAGQAELEGALSAVGRMSPDEAKARMLEALDARSAALVSRRLRDAEAEAQGQAARFVLEAMQRCASRAAAEASVDVVPLASEDLKGRIIGREGRNIRAFEQVTGVDLIVDDVPDSVVLSCFDPMRREIARVALLSLLKDGRIQPARIEELYAVAKREVEGIARQAALEAVAATGVQPVSGQVLDALGRLRFRSSYGQNVLDHSVEVSRLAGIVAAELGLDQGLAKRAGLLHDIGKALDPTWEGAHATSGMAFLRSCGEPEHITVAVGGHHDDMSRPSLCSAVVAVADAISASRPGARRDTLENYVKRLSALEELATAFAGVDQAYAIQAGREVRVVVRPHEVDDDGATILAHDIAERIERELSYAGQVKVTVIRETRAFGLAGQGNVPA